MRKVTRSIQEGARDFAKTDAYVVSRCERKKVEMLFAHPKRILKLDRLRLRGPNGTKDGFFLATIAQNLRKLAKLILPPTPVVACNGSDPPCRLLSAISAATFFNKIGAQMTQA